MVTIYKQKTKKNEPQYLQLNIERWDHEAQGIAFHEGKICFVAGALPGERVQVKVTEQKAHYLKAQVQSVLQPSMVRIKPQCPVAAQCGGCQLQYVNPDHAPLLKQQGVQQLLNHQLGQSALDWQPALTAPASGYRRKARIGVWYQQKDKSFDVGFRKVNSNEILSVDHCMVLSPVIAPVLSVLKQTLPRLKHGSAVTHVEVLDAAGQAFVLVRHIKPLADTDKSKLMAAWPEACWLGEAESGVIDNWQSDSMVPSYQLADGLQLQFGIDDFIQVNHQINQQMVQQAQDWLQINSSDQVLDLYCGIGNFSLAMAKTAAKVVGVEGLPAMVRQAAQNAGLNGLSNVDFIQADLHLPWGKVAWAQPVYDKVVLDPARAGAAGAVEQIAALKPSQILYVSCNPTTFARDAKVLLSAGYRISKIGMMDMFPYTSHLEMMALFERTRQ